MQRFPYPFDATTAKFLDSAIGAQSIASPMGPLQVSTHYSTELIKIIGRLIVRPIRRLRSTVQNEYDEGHWRKVLETKEWKVIPDLEAFLTGSDRRPIVAKLLDRSVNIERAEYYRLKQRAFAHLLTSMAGDADELVELGCGYGYNLFSLALINRWRMLHGFDISPNGIAAGREIASYFGLENVVRFDLLDLTDSNQHNFREIHNKVVFTWFCVEQIPRDVEAVIDTLIAHRPKRVIHIEPTTELLVLWKPMDLLNFLYVKSVDYQTRLFGTVERKAREGIVRVVERRRLGFSPTIHNDGFIIVWEPT